MMNPNVLYLAAGGSVLALDLGTGAEIWRRKLKAATVMTIHERGTRLLVTGVGEIWCLDRSTGEEIWHNGLKGLGQGYVAVAGHPRSGAATMSSGGDDTAMFGGAGFGDAGDCSDGGAGCD